MLDVDLIALVKGKYEKHDPLVIELLSRYEKLYGLINKPEVIDFTRGMSCEFAFQNLKWGDETLDNYTHEDWFWVVGYLAGKAVHCFENDKHKKGLHHTITTAAVLSHWHSRALSGKISDKVHPNNLSVRKEFTASIIENAQG